MPCACTPTTRCARAWELRDQCVAARQQGDYAARRAAVLAYTAHVQALGEFDGWPPGSEAWPLWPEDDHLRPGR